MASKKSGGTQYIDLIPSPGIRRGFLFPAPGAFVIWPPECR